VIKNCDRTLYITDFWNFRSQIQNSPTLRNLNAGTNVRSIKNILKKTLDSSVTSENSETKYRQFEMKKNFEKN